MPSISHQIATELNARENQINAAITLLDEGATVPFIARYRKEVTGGLDDGQLRQLDQRLTYLRELDDRRQVILKSIEEQGKLTDHLRKAVSQADTKTHLEDLYLPYKPKRRTKGQMAIEAGLTPLAEKLLADPTQDPDKLAANYHNPAHKITDNKAALEGARYILMERLAVDAPLIDKSRRFLRQQATLESKVAKGKEQEGAKFSDYFNYSEAISKIPSHRALALLRGRNEGILQLSLNADPAQQEGQSGSYGETIIAEHIGFRHQKRPADQWLHSVIQATWRIKLMAQLETELVTALREQAEQSAIQVFAKNLHDLLMAAPAGPRATLGLDPGLRTGVKVAAVDSTGKLLTTTTVYPHAPQKQWDKALHTLEKICRQHAIELISIGNGTASRETDKLAADLIQRAADLPLTKIMISEAGASVYSASELAANEFPELDVSLRGAVSIARRLQDPLAELVKIDPKAIGVGQYQHDVNQTALAKQLATVVEDCVNAVGVDVNTASAALLSHVSGLSNTLANNIVAYRNENGRFTSRKQLKKVSRLGPKAFEQCAGFLRIQGGKDPLDSSAVHPEAYPVVKKISTQTQQSLDAIIGNSAFLKTLQARDFIDETFGIPTVTDILRELDKPGRDPRPEFKTAAFQEGVEKISDLHEEMVLEGVVTNVTHFGAFVDIGVHQDGLVHISHLTDKYVANPMDVVKAGDIVNVKVLSVDVARKRISLSMRLSAEAAASRAPSQSKKQSNGQSAPHRQKSAGQSTKSATAKATNTHNASGAFADAFAKAKTRKN